MVQENRISRRQLRRMLFIEIFGTGALSIPAFACYKGQSGFFSTFFYGIFLFIITFVFNIFFEKTQNNISEKVLIKNYADMLPKTVQIVYIIRFFINATALFYFFGKTMQVVYMPRSGFLFILFPAALLLWYSLQTNLQKRARFLELIFPWIAVMYLVAVILSFVGIKNITQAGVSNGIWTGAFSDTIFQSVQNAYFLLLCSSPVEFLLFLRPAVDEVESGKKERINVFTAVFGAFLCNIILIFLAVRTLGQTLTGQSMWPVIKMMQLIRMPGGFLERFDILPIIFWILCMTAVLSGYLYYGRNIFEKFFYATKNIKNDKTQKYETEGYKGSKYLIDKSSGYLYEADKTPKYFSKCSIPIFTGIGIMCLLFLTWFVEKQPVLWTFYLKYKAFVDFPLSLLLPIITYTINRKREKNINESQENLKNQEEKILWSQKESKQGNNLKKIKWFAIKMKLTIFTLIMVSSTFLLSGCQRLTDVEEKSYILSLYIDYSSDEKGVYEFWVARADLNEMEERDEEIPCEITKIKARNLKELEEKYIEIVSGETEWNHIYTIFLGSGIAEEKSACTDLLKEWDKAWQKSPNVLLALCSEPPDKLYKIKTIPEGAAGQEANLLVEQNRERIQKQRQKQNRKQNIKQNIEFKKENYAEEICETPIDYLRATEKKTDKIILYRIMIENEKIKITL